MANFSSYNFKKNGAQHLKDNGNIIALALNPLSTDSYPQLNAKLIASSAMTGADVTLAAEGNDLKMTINGKSIDPSDTGLATDDLAVVILDSANSEVILCQDATDRIITNEAGDTVAIPSLITYIRELTSV